MSQSQSGESEASVPAPLSPEIASVVADSSVAVASESPKGPTGADLLTRSLLGEAWSLTEGTRSASGSDASVPAPPSPSAGPRSRRTSTAGSRRSGGFDDAAAGPPPARNWDELADLLRELHRNQLWFTYVFASAREQIEAGPRQQVESMQQTLSDLSLAVDTTQATKRRMVDIQRRIEAAKAKVTGWRTKQDAAAAATSAVAATTADAAAATTVAPAETEASSTTPHRPQEATPA